MKENWHGLMKILEIQHIRNNEVIWEKHDLYNIMHTGGDQFCLMCCFDNDGSYPPEKYYFGLDNRPSLNFGDVIDDLIDEPNINGYARQSIDSYNGFTVSSSNGIYRASSGIITFSATSGSWGAVSNLFLVGNNILIASAPLSDSVTLEAGDSFNVRMSLSLRDATQ